MNNIQWQRPSDPPLNPSYQKVMDRLWSEIEVTEQNARHLSNLPYWTFEECKLIALGIAPHLMRDRVLKRVISVLKLQEYYRKLHEPFKRAYQVGELGEQMQPRYFVKWAEKNGIPLPESILSAVALKPEHELPTPSNNASGAIDNNPKSNKSAQTRTDTSLYKLIYGMAKSKYRFDQQGFSKNAVSAILSDLDRLGIAMSENTIRTHLQKSKEFHDNSK